MTYTPDDIADHIAQRVAAVGEDKGVLILRQLVVERDAADANAQKERATRFDWLAKRHRITTLNWLRASKKALSGDTAELRNRIDMAEADPVQVVLSDAALSTQEKAHD